MLQANMDARGETKPPFTAQELLTVAAVMCDQRCIGLETLAAWILTNLRYYNRNLVQAHPLHRLENAFRCPYEDVLPGVYAIVMRWDMPWTYHNLQRSCKIDEAGNFTRSMLSPIT